MCNLYDLSLLNSFVRLIPFSRLKDEVEKERQDTTIEEGLLMKCGKKANKSHSISGGDSQD